MDIYYDSENNTFYLEAVHKVIPQGENIYKINEKKHQELLDCLNSGNTIEIKKGKPVPTNKKVEKSKEDLKDFELSSSRLYLRSTDWYVLRFIETGKEIPEEVKIKREEARQKLSESGEK